MSLPLNKPFALAKQYKFQWEPAQQCFVLLYPEGLIKLADSAGAIIKRIDGESSTESIIKQLETAFPGADLRLDVIVFLEHAHDKGWITIR